MKVLVTGGGGQLARAIAATWGGHDVVLSDRKALDLGDPGAAARVLALHRPQVVVNAGAYTQVDRCESEPRLARLVNADAVGWLAEACNGIGALLVQISTDYVFDGHATRPYREDDPTAPATVYGRTKLDGEARAREARNHLIVRTSWLYEAWGNNFLRTMLRAAARGRTLKVVDDQRGTPTSCRALARQLERSVLEEWRGLVHASCQGETTWYGFAKEIFRVAGIPADLHPCSTAEYPTPAPRPAYSVLSGTHRGELGSDVMPDWEAAMPEVLADVQDEW